MKKRLAVVCGTLTYLVFQCHAGIITLDSDANVEIPDNNPDSGALSDISFSSGGIVGSVNSISFSIAGGWAGDYTVVLQHTDGTTSQSVTLLKTLNAGNAANSGFGFYNGTGNYNVGGNMPVTISLTGSGDIRTAGSSSSTAPITGTYNVSASGINLNSFQNASANGDWLLYVTDDQAGDHGSLIGWSMEMEVVPEPINIALAIFGATFVLVAAAKSNFAKRFRFPKSGR